MTVKLGLEEPASPGVEVRAAIRSPSRHFMVEQTRRKHGALIFSLFFVAIAGAIMPACS